MATQVTLHRSTDIGAPTITGQAGGTLITMLTACLVGGYNPHTLTSITSTGTTATATFNGHGYAVDGLTKILHTGANEAKYNGVFHIFNVTANTYDFTVDAAGATTATGSITSKVCPIGYNTTSGLAWESPYSGTNGAIFRSSETTGTRLFLRIDDNNPNADSNLSANAIVYETASGFSSGLSGPCPTAAQLANGIVINKTVTADATARPWVCVGDGFEFLLFIAFNSAYPNIYKFYHFGDPASEMATDPYGFFIMGDTAKTVSTPETSSSAHTICTTIGMQAVLSGHYMSKGYVQTGTSVQVGKFGDYSGAGSAIIGGGTIPYPATTNNGLYISPIKIGDPSINIRAILKCIYQPLHTRPLGHGGLSTNVSGLSGRTLYAVATANSGANAGETHVDITGPWR